MHITCPENKVIKVAAFISGAFRECLDIHAQTPTSPSVIYDDKTNAGTGKMDLEITANVEGITYERTGLCKGISNSESNSMSYSGNITMIGVASGTPVNLTVS